MQGQKEICRLCRKSDFNTISLLDGRGSSGILLREMLKLTCQIEIAQDDPFTKSVCPLCIWNLNKTYNFIIICKNSHKSFCQSNSESLKSVNSLSEEPREEQIEIGLIKDTHASAKNSPVSEEQQSEEQNINEIPLEVEKQVTEIATEHSPEIDNDDNFWADDNNYSNDSNSLSSIDEFDLDRKVKQQMKLQKKLQKSEAKNTGTKKKKYVKKIRYDVCEICGKKLSSKRHLEDHMNTHTKRTPIILECALCGKKFKSKPCLQGHLLHYHMGNTNHTCEVCGKSYASSGNLKTHKKIHTNERPFQCTICPFKTRKNANLRSHMRTHTGELTGKYKCDLCDKPFAYKHNLDVHKRSHLNDRRFKCGICKKKFIEKAALTDHTRTHTGERPFECNFCDRKFSQRNAMRSHMKTHSECKTFECCICKKKYLKELALKLHLRTHGYDNYDITEGDVIKNEMD